MWWQPRNENEQEITTLLTRINDLFLSKSATVPEVHGIGSTTLYPGEHFRVPLIILDNKLEYLFASERRQSILRRNARGIIRSISELRWKKSPYRQRENLFIPFGKAPSGVSHLLRRWNLPNNTLIFLSPPPSPLADPGDGIWCGDKSATIGIELMADGSRYIYTTAGHLAVDQKLPASIYVRKRQWFRADREEWLGHIVFSHDPIGTPGIDVGIVEIPYRFASNLPGLSVAHEVEDLAETTLLGGASGRQVGWINGAYKTTRELNGRIWTNVWSVNESDAGFVRKGDSGGVVFNSNGNILGHVVAGLGKKRKRGAFQVGLVQHAESVIEYLRSNYDSTIVPVAPAFHSLPVNSGLKRFLRFMP